VTTPNKIIVCPSRLSFGDMIFSQKKEVMGRKSKFDKMPVLNPNAAGVDVGGKFHLVAIGQSSDEVRQFGAYTEDLHELANLPDNLTDSLKQYTRHRQKLQSNGADCIKKMQKAMRLMNIRLDNVLSDVVGKSGQAIYPSYHRRRARCRSLGRKDGLLGG